VIYPRPRGLLYPRRQAAPIPRGDQLSAFSPLLANLTDPMTVRRLLAVGIDPKNRRPL